MQPNRQMTGANLSVGDLSFPVPENSSRFEPERFHQKMMRFRNIVINQDWNYPLKFALSRCANRFHRDNFGESSGGRKPHEIPHRIDSAKFGAAGTWRDLRVPMR